MVLVVFEEIDDGRVDGLMLLHIFLQRKVVQHQWHYLYTHMHAHTHIHIHIHRTNWNLMYPQNQLY